MLLTQTCSIFISIIQQWYYFFLFYCGEMLPDSTVLKFLQIIDVSVTSPLHVAFMHHKL